MKVFTAKGFTGHYPVGTAAVVVAESAKEAALVLQDKLRTEHSLPATTIKPEDLQELDILNIKAVVLCDGDY